MGLQTSSAMPPKTHNIHVKGIIDLGPGRKVIKKAAVETASLNDAFSAALSGASRVDVASQLTKRKPADGVDDFDVEILDGPAIPSPSRGAKELPIRDLAESGHGPTGSSDNSKVITAGSKDDAADISTARPFPLDIDLLKASDAAALGTPSSSIPEEPGTLYPAPVILSASGRPVRNKNMTEKARLAEHAIATLKNKRKPMSQVHAEAAVARQSQEASRVLSGPPQVPGSPARATTEESDLLDVSELFQIPAKGGHSRLPQTPTSEDEEVSPETPTAKESNPFINAEADDGSNSSNASDAEEGSVISDAKSNSLSDAIAVTSSPQAEGEHDIDAQVMDPDLWHPSMVEGYKSLPAISTFMDVVPYSQGNQYTDLSSMHVSVGDMMHLIPQGIQSLAAGLSFVRSGAFVNMARITPSALMVDAGHIKLVDMKQLAVGIMLGVVTDCSLFTAATSGSQSSQFEVHCITIAPAPQEMRRDTSIWGGLLRFPDGVISGPSSPLGFSFSTFPKGKGGNRSSGSAPASPTKTFKFATTVTSPKVAHTSGFSFSQPVRFEDEVPIFDGRGKHGMKQFMFTPADFKSLSTLPGRRRYHRNKVEIPDESVVAVGYTVGTYATPRSMYLSSNVLFVVVLGTPSDVPKEVDQGQAE